MRQRLAKLAPQIGFLDAIRAELPEDGIFVEEVTQMGFAARLAFPVYKPRTFISPGFQDALGWGYATALGVQDARRDVPVVAISGDGGFLFTATEMATAIHHRIPAGRGRVRRRRLRQRAAHPGGALTATASSPATSPIRISCASPRASAPPPSARARRRSCAPRSTARFKRRDGPTLIEVPVGPLPSPWEFIQLPRVRGG